MKKSLLALTLISLVVCTTSCNQNSTEQTSGTTDSTANSSQTKSITTPSRLIYTILKAGAGPSAQAGQEVMIHENMSYMNDSLLFSSRKQTGPVKVLIGAHQAIEGVDEGLRGMQVGEVRKLIVPPALSKRTGVHTFPHPDSTLLYEIELMEILGDKK